MVTNDNIINFKITIYKKKGLQIKQDIYFILSYNMKIVKVNQKIKEFFISEN